MARRGQTPRRPQTISAAARSCLGLLDESAAVALNRPGRAQRKGAVRLCPTLLEKIKLIASRGYPAYEMALFETSYAALAARVLA